MHLTYVLAGAHGTGKTTLLNELKKIDQYNFSTSSTRTSGAVLNEDGNDEGQLKILEAIKRYEIDNDLYKKDFILDRSFIDFYSYSKYLHAHGKITDETLEVIHNEFMLRKDYYNMVFYLPIEFDIEDDGTRSSDVQFQKEIDRYIWETITENELGCVIVSGDLDTRVLLVKYHIPIIDHITSKSEITDNILKKIDAEGGTEYLDDNSYVITHHDEVVALLSYKKTDRLKISYLYSLLEYRGIGFASKLMNKLLAEHLDTIVYLYIKNEAYVFYQKYGIAKFIIGESIYSGPIPNYYATFYNTIDGFKPVLHSEIDESRIKQFSDNYLVTSID